MDDFVAVITSRAARLYGRSDSKWRAKQIRGCIQACAKRCVEQVDEVDEA